MRDLCRRGGRALARSAVRNRRRAIPTRQARLETLEDRVVLSGVTASAPVTTATTAGPETAHFEQLEASITVDQTSAGVLRINLASSAESVVVRQFVDYRLRSVIEVESAGRWLDFQESAVRAIDLVVPADGGQVAIDPLVDKPVHQTYSHAVDLAFESEEANAMANTRGTGDELVATVESAALAQLGHNVGDPETTPMDGIIAEGEGPPGGSGTPELMPPSITSFSAQNQFGFWSFSGTVLDDKPVAGLSVRFGGLLDGYSATVDENGAFELVVQLPGGTSGTATAQTTDGDGLDSNVASTQV